jgi:hypothetical protein
MALRGDASFRMAVRLKKKKFEEKQKNAGSD